MAIDIDLAIGQKVPLHTEGDYLLLRSAAGSIELSKNGGQGYGMQVGETIETKSINQFVLKNTSGLLNTVVFESIDFEVKSSSNAGVQVLNEPWLAGMRNPVQVAATVESSNTNTHLPVVNCVAGVATLVAAADATRKELRLNIDTAQSGGLFLGKLGIIANQGGFIDIGQTDYISTEGALYAFNDNTEDVAISVLSMERV